MGRRIAAFLIFAAVHVVGADPSQAASRWFGGDLSGGVQTLDLTRTDEARKFGIIGNARAMFELRTERFGAFSLGLGAQYSDQQGSTEIWRQRIKTLLPALDLGFLYPVFGDRFHLGFLVRNQYGKGAHFDIFDLDRAQYLGTIGPQVEVRLGPVSNQLQWVIGAAALFDFSATGRAIRQFPVSIGLRIPLEPRPSPTPNSTPEPSPTPQEQAQEPLEIQLDSSLINFDRNKDVLRPEARSFLEEIAELLNSQSDNWETLSVSGHTDTTGRASRNTQLSKERAAAVVRFLTERGVDAGRIESDGFGSSRLLPGLDREDPAHRRVEFSFEGVKDKKRFKELFDAAIERARSAAPGGSP